MTVSLPNPFLESAAGPADRQARAASCSTPAEAVGATNLPREVFAAAPGMAQLIHISDFLKRRS